MCIQVSRSIPQRTRSHTELCIHRDVVEYCMPLRAEPEQVFSDMYTESGGE